MKKLAIALFVLCLMGCKVEIEKKISLNDLLNTPLKTEGAQLSVEIASCQDHRDSRQPSQSLLQAQAKIPQVFKDANFKECYSSNFKSFAVFEIPVSVGSVGTDSSLKNDISIASLKEDGSVLVLVTKKSFNDRMNKFKKSEPMLGNIELGVTFYISNDLKDEQKLNIISSYINDVPFVNATTFLKPGELLKVKLSDVAADQLVSIDKSGGIVHLITQAKDK
ncbi:DUF7424 family protein [Haemophilus haemolyticus]|uniref:DUF7424 family protein n=1 Tax=Haemophilus haemolyticus TaxID=726 RepID=UPI000E56B6EB|nr:hypothetical protein [Haemophilus haemolyticus]